MKKFSYISAPLLDNFKGGKKKKFQWTTQVDISFEYLKDNVAQYPILTIPTFNTLFTVEIDGRTLAIGANLSQEGKLVAFFSEKIE